MTDRGSPREPDGRAGADGPPSVFIVAGEASGDWAGGLLARALLRRRPDVVLRGVGGERMAAAGVDLMVTSTEWGAIGILDALRKLPTVWRAFRRLCARLSRERPSGLVLIDCGAVNMRVARVARRLGLPTLYYLPPRSWSRRRQATSLPELVDAVATPFPWSRDLLAGGSARVEWVGHPAVEAVRPQLSAQDAWTEYQLDPDHPVVVLGPGSRDQEMHHVLPVLAEAAALLLAARQGVQFVVPVANPVFEKTVWDAFDRVGVRFTLLHGMDYNALAQEIVGWLQAKLDEAGARGFVVGLSGGIDSAVTAALCARAAPGEVLGAWLPCYSSSEDEACSRMVAKALCRALLTA